MADTDIQRLISKLLRGASSDRPETTYEAFRQLYKLGPSIVPLLEVKLRQADWSTLRYGFEVKFLSILLSLLYDVDFAAGERVATDLLKRNCHQSCVSIIKAIRKEQNWPYRTYNIRTLRVYEDTSLDPAHDIKNRLKDWLKVVPDEDLSGIHRLNVILEPYRADYEGNYMPILAVINLIWKYRTFRSFDHFLLRNTLYHEIGHHVHRHTFGQDPEQEREANRYAAHMHITHSPWLKVIRYGLSLFRRNRASQK